MSQAAEKPKPPVRAKSSRTQKRKAKGATQPLAVREFCSGFVETTRRLRWNKSAADTSLDDLPFIGRNDRGHMVWWQVRPPATNYGAVHQLLGRSYAYEYLDFLNSPSGGCSKDHLSFIATDMMRSSTSWQDQEVVRGFFEALGEYLVTGRLYR